MKGHGLPFGSSRGTGEGEAWLALWVTPWHGEGGVGTVLGRAGGIRRLDVAKRLLRVGSVWPILPHRRDRPAWLAAENPRHTTARGGDDRGPITDPRAMSPGRRPGDMELGQGASTAVLRQGNPC